MQDNRMGWIRFLENPGEATGARWVEDWEIASECRITGKLDEANGKLIFSPHSFEPDENSLYKYVIRFSYPMAVRDTEEVLRRSESATKRGYHFKGGAPAELVALISVALRCRVFVVACERGAAAADSIPTKHDLPFRYQKVAHASLPVLFQEGNRNFVHDLAPFLKLVKGLETARHNRFMLACHHYARALRDVGTDTEMVFLRLVSTIEALSRDYEFKKGDHALNGKKYSALFAGASLSADEDQSLREILLVDDDQIAITRLKQRFIRFAFDYSTGALRGGNRKAKHLWIGRAKVPQALAAIYDARSSYLHNGEPMYLSQFMGAYPKWDTDPSLGMISDNRRFDAKSKLPYVSWFENVVRSCLLNYLRRHQTTAAVTPKVRARSSRS